MMHGRRHDAYVALTEDRKPVVGDTGIAPTVAARDLAIAGGLAVGVALTRLPFRGTVLYHWDSINFARALDRFDVAASQPHIPGYPLYVLLGRAVRGLDGDPQTSLVAISIGGSLLAVAALYVLGTAMFGARSGLFAALALASSPLFWFYGEIALPHCVDAFMVTVAVWLLWRVDTGAHHLWPVVAIWLAATGGFRPQSQTFLLPLTVYVLVRNGWHRTLPVALGLLVVGNLAWLVPLVWLSGGYARYTDISRSFYATFMTPTALWSGGITGLIRNAIKLTSYTAYAWSAGALPVVFILARRIFRIENSPFTIHHSPLKRTSARRRHTWFLALWMAPTIGVYLFVHMGQQGLVFVYLPALCLLSGVALDRLDSRIAVPLVGVVLAINAAVFLTAPTFPLHTDRLKLLTRDTLRRHDASYAARLAAVRALSAQHTALLSSAWRFPEYYLSEYPLIRYGIGSKWEHNEGRPLRNVASMIDLATLGLTPDGDGYYTVVLFDDALASFNRDRKRTQDLALPNGEHLAYLRLAPDERLQLDAEAFLVLDPRNR